MEQPNLGKIIAISSGKGGVGKSTVAANLAVALAQAGFQVGVMDADVYGPNIPRMFGVFDRPPVSGGKIQPLEAHGVRLMSLGLLVERDAPAIWRGPIIMKIVNQFLRDVEWGQLDYFIVDLPLAPATRSSPWVQATHVSGAVIVTTHRKWPSAMRCGAPRCSSGWAVPVIGCGRKHEWIYRRRDRPPVRAVLLRPGASVCRRDQRAFARLGALAAPPCRAR